MNQYVTGAVIKRLREEKNMTQQKLADKLSVSAKTISKWETDETLPDIRQSKNRAVLYGLSLDELIGWDGDSNLQEIQEAIDRTSDETADKIDWTKAWSKKYPILARYQNEVEIPYYAKELRRLLDDLEKKSGYGELDSMLVLKDILASVWKNKKGKAQL